MPSATPNSRSESDGCGARAVPARRTLDQRCTLGDGFVSSPRPPIRRGLPAFVYGFLALAFSLAALAGETELAASARRAFDVSGSLYHNQPTNTEAAWQFGRACFDLAEFATNRAGRADLATQGISACRRGVEQASNSAPPHYYLALNIGQLARTKSLGALKLVGQMEREFHATRVLDEHFDNAGSDRGLGLLYRDAPVFGSIGSRTKAKAHLQRAVELSPDYPENRLALAESELKWGERSNALEQLKMLEIGLPAAHQTLKGPDQAANWADWEPRLLKLREKLEPPPKAP